jgi:hypothetical protein
MVLAIEPCAMTPPRRSFQRKVEEASTTTGLKTYAPNDLSVGGTRLISQEKVIFERREIWRNP